MKEQIKKCRSCDAPIIWKKTIGGKWIPLDATSEERFFLRGQIAIVADAYTTHFMSCPNAAKHRKKKEGKDGK